MTSTMARERASSAGGGESPITIDVRPDGIAVLTYDLVGESMNVLRADFVDAFNRTLAAVESNPDVRAAVLVSGKEDFIVGADVSMLRAIRSRDDAEAMVHRGHDALSRLAAASKPVVAAIHGQALGGGFEVALACSGRVLSSSKRTKLGFPEVKLGLIPGLNGLQRLAELTGLQVALEHGLTGKSIHPGKAKRLGIADDVVRRSILVEVAAELALALSRGERKRSGKRGLPDVGELTKLALEDNPIGRSILFKKVREQTRKSTGGHYPAPERAIDVLEVYAKRGFEASQQEEARAFGELVMSEVAANLMSIFFATTELKKDSGVLDPDVEPRRIDKIGMLGAGLMGAGIAYVSIDNGIEVRLKDRDAPSLGRGLKYVVDILDDRLNKRHIDKGERTAKLALLSHTTDYSGMHHVDLVIEAVFEDLELKRRVLAEVEAACQPTTIFASNTSSIPIAKIAEGAQRPHNVVGMHYFSPVHKMPLLEVIRTEQTADEVVATAVAVGKRQGKTVIVVNDSTGFYTSRIIGPYMNEASHILAEGAAIETIDRALKAWGWPVGPIKLLDEVGIDVAAHVGPVMLKAFGNRMQPPAIASRLLADGRKGRKNERGFYLYGEAKKKAKGKQVDETVYEALGLPVPDPDRPSPVAVDEIQERCSLQFVNEAMHCYSDGILRSPRDGDIGAIFGLGFPPFLGGPFRYVDRQGARAILSRIEAYQDRFGARWTPAPALVEMARSGKKFYE